MWTHAAWLNQIATIRALYREELLRDPDCDGLPAYLWRMGFYHDTPEMIRAYLRASEEWQAKHQPVPPVPPAPPVTPVTPISPLRIDGRWIGRTDGQPWRWRGITAFALAAQVAQGREADAVAFMDWAEAHGFTLLRVLAMCEWLHLSPEQGRAALPRVLELAAERGLYVEVVALADTASFFDVSPVPASPNGNDGRLGNTKTLPKVTGGDFSVQAPNNPDGSGGQLGVSVPFSARGRSSGEIVVDLGVLPGGRQDQQVLGPVIVPDSVEVVNNLGPQDWSPESPFGNKNSSSNVPGALDTRVIAHPDERITMNVAGVPALPPVVAATTLPVDSEVVSAQETSPAESAVLLSAGYDLSAPTGAGGGGAARVFLDGMSFDEIEPLTTAIAGHQLSTPTSAEWSGLGGSASLGFGIDVSEQIRDHVRRVAEVCASHKNCLLEVSNEFYHTSQHQWLRVLENLNSLAVEIPAGVLYALSAGTDDESIEPGGLFINRHLDRGRDPWNQIRRVRELEDLSARTGKPVISGEPMGFGEGTEGKDRWTDPAYAYAFGVLSRIMEVGTTFHCEAGLQCVLPGPAQTACIDAFIAGTRVLPDDITLAFRNAGWDSSPVKAADFDKVVRAYSGVGARNLLALVGLSGDPRVEFRGTWHTLCKLGSYPGIEVWEMAE